MEELFVACALALPPMSHSQHLLVGFIKSYKPAYDVVFVNKDEKLVGGEWTPVIYKGLRVWMVKKAA